MSPFLQCLNFGVQTGRVTVIRIGEEHPPPAVAALRHMVGQAGNDHTGETSHL